jgi:uncharacterized membrane protein
VKTLPIKSRFDVMWKRKGFLPFVLFLQFTFDITTLCDVPVAKQVIGFLCLTFVPGLIIVKLLKLDELDILEMVLFSGGLGVAFVMIAGLSINELLFSFGVSQPLSAVPLMIFLNSFTLVGGVLVYSRSEGVKIRVGQPFKMSPFALLFLFLPILSIVGAMYVNAYQNNKLLLFMIIVISLLFAFGVMSKKLLPSELYPFALLMIAIAVLYHASLISNYIDPFGSDVATEYFLFRTTANNAHWSSTLPFLLNDSSSIAGDYGRENAMLAITILPTVYSTLLKMDSTWMFKLLFPMIFAFVPLGLYQMWQKYIGKKYAFISAFLFIAQETFFSEMLGLNRQIIAELFFVLLLVVILNEKIKPVNKMMCFVIFSFGLITSHYALALIFLFFISFTVVSLIVLKHPSRRITVSMVVLFLAIMFTWYIYTSGSATFNSFLKFGNAVYGHLGEFFNPASRGQTVLTGLGVAQSPSIWNTISRGFAYLTEALIAVGFIGLASAYARGKIRIKNEYFILSSTAMAFLAMVILVPYLANTLNMTRFYHILLFFLAPLCVMGTGFVVRLLSKREKELTVCALLLIVLVPFFLFQTEFVFEVTGSTSWSIPLSGYRMNALELYGHYGYTDVYSVYGAQWLSRDVDLNNSELYADGSGETVVLIMYGMIYIGYVNVLSNTTIVADGGVVYLSTLNVVANMIPSEGLLWNTSQLSSVFNDLNALYANGGSEIYKHSP